MKEIVATLSEAIEKIEACIILLQKFDELDFTDEERQYLQKRVSKLIKKHTTGDQNEN